MNQRVMSVKNGSASSIGFSKGYFYRNVGASKKRMKKAISQVSLRNTQAEGGSSRMQHHHLPETNDAKI